MAGAQRIVALSNRKSFRWYWRRKSIHRGRPVISPTTIATIRRIHRENPLWSPERIHDQLVSLGLTDVFAPNTIANHLPATRKPPSEKRQQSWRTFLANHREGIWAIDFCTVPALLFTVLYVLVIISHDQRIIRHVAATAHPHADWVIQQLREAKPFLSSSGGICSTKMMPSSSVRASSSSSNTQASNRSASASIVHGRMASLSE